MFVAGCCAVCPCGVLLCHVPHSGVLRYGAVRCGVVMRYVPCDVVLCGGVSCHVSRVVVMRHMSRGPDALVSLT